MADIWDKVTEALVGQIPVALYEMRQREQFKAMGSEIERAFAGYFTMGVHINGTIPLTLGLPKEPVPGWFLAPQVSIGEYRVDFLYGYCRDFDNWRRCLVIECDGHDFHEKTKEQAARDKSRDRFLSTQVGRVIRFSGSEIYRDVASCWLEVGKVHRAATEVDQ